MIDSLAQSHRQVYLADIRAGMPRNGRYFNDSCHLTPAGSQGWVEILVGALPARPPE